MKTYIICKNSQQKGIINFFMQYENKEYFLFYTKYRHSTYNYFKNGVVIEKALDYSKAHCDTAITNVIKRLYSNIPYIEKEYGFKARKKSNKKIKTVNTLYDNDIAC